MTTTLESDPLVESKTRIENSDNNTYNRAFPKRKRREFRYSDRRLYKQMKMYAASAVADKGIYCRFLGPSGVTLAAPTTEDTKPVLTYMRYPVSYRRRMRFFNDFTEAEGTPDLTQYVESNMTVFRGDYDQVAKYLEYANDKDSCVSAAETAGALTDNIKIARYCCEANKWSFTVPSED